MSKEIRKIEKDIFELIESKTKIQQKGTFYTSILLAGDDTTDSLTSKIERKKKERQFKLEEEERNYKRKFYNQSWFHILITAVISIITTVVAAWIISKF